MKVLLIDPFEHQAVYGRVRYPPGAPSLGLAYIASYLRQNKVDVYILDAKGKGLSIKEISAFVRDFKSSIIGLTSTTPVFGNAIQIAKQVKSVRPDAKLIMGGPHITGQGAQIFEKWGDIIDALVIGEGEQTCLEIAQGKDLQSIRGVAYLNDGVPTTNPPRPLINDLDSIPLPARDFFDLNDYSHPLNEIYGKPLSTIISGRGCPFRCSFCSSQATFGRNVRYRSVGNVMEEIDFLKKRYGIKTIMFYDDTFALNEKRVEEMCSELARRELSWICNARVNTVTKKMLQTMKASGCELLYFGLESGDPLILNELQKDINVEQMRQAFTWTKEIGIDTAGTFIFGSPSETRETIMKTIEIAKELSPTFVNFFILSPYPGTKVYREMSEKGYMKQFEWTDVHAPKYGNPLINHPNISEKELIRFQKRAYRRFYIRPRYVLNLLKSIDGWRRLQGYLSLGLNFVRMVR